MSLTPILIPQDFNGKGAMSLPNQPAIPAETLKATFDSPAREVCAPAVNRLIGELEATTASQSLGATAPTGRGTATTVQGVLNKLSSDLGTVESSIATVVAHDHTHTNKAVLDDLSDDSGTLKYRGSTIGEKDYANLNNKPSINGVTLSGNKTSSDLGLMPATTLATVATSGDYNDLSNKPTIPAAQVNADWNAASGVAQILNKPTIPTVPVQNAYKTVDVTSGGSTTHVTASGGEDTIELEAGTNITLTATGKSIKIDSAGGGGGGGTSYTASKGVTISGTDIEADLASYTASSYAATVFGSTANRTYAVGLDSNSKLAVNIPWTDTTYSDATTTAHGLMSTTDKSKLDGIAAGAEVNVNADWNASSGDAQILNKPTIPSKTSDLTNDSGYQTASDVSTAISGKANTSDLDDWVATATVSSGSVTFTGVNDTGNYGYKLFCNITSSSTNLNPSAQLSSISGEGTSSMSLTYTTDADNGATCKLRRIK